VSTKARHYDWTDYTAQSECDYVFGNRLRKGREGKELVEPDHGWLRLILGSVPFPVSGCSALSQNVWYDQADWAATVQLAVKAVLGQLGERQAGLLERITHLEGRVAELTAKVAEHDAVMVAEGSFDATIEREIGAMLGAVSSTEQKELKDWLPTGADLDKEFGE
jgi:hypothetical protein